MVHIRLSRRELGWTPVFQSARWILHKLYVCNVILATEILKYCSNSSIYASATMPQKCKDHILLLIHIRWWHDVIFIYSKFPYASTKSFCPLRFVINKTPSKLPHLLHGTNVKKCISMGGCLHNFAMTYHLASNSLHQNCWRSNSDWCYPEIRTTTLFFGSRWKLTWWQTQKPHWNR